MNKMMKVGLGLAAAAAVAFAGGCAEHAPAYQCGHVDYKSMASCKGTNVTTVTTPSGKKVHRVKVSQ